jgi:tRNA threonylcarbamoyladenosine biosynthesis protein TsaE
MRGVATISPRVIHFPGIDEAAFAGVARALAPRVRDGAVIHLAGPLGVGARIKSPTYTLIESYPVGDLTAHHLDLYRIAAADEVEWLGLRDLAAGKQLWLIEWPERALAAIPSADLLVELAHAATTRNLELTALTPAASKWLDGIGVLPE